MKLNFSTVFLISSFLLIGFLGFTGIISTGHMGSHLCPISVMTGNQCPPVGSFALENHHVSGLSSFLSSINATNIAGSILAGFILLAAFLIFKIKDQSIFKQSILAAQQFRKINKPASERQEKFFHWSSLHNKRDLCAT